MSNRGLRRDRAARHDSRRYLKQHPPRRSDPLVGLRPREEWALAVAQVVRAYPRDKKRREDALKNGGRRTGRVSPSAERVFFRHYGGTVGAVDAALERFSPADRAELLEFITNGTRKPQSRWKINRFFRLVAVFLGYGREEWRL